MQAAIDVFINGIAGVFAGITVLYIAIRLNFMPRLGDVMTVPCAGDNAPVQTVAQAQLL